MNIPFGLCPVVDYPEFYRIIITENLIYCNTINKNILFAFGNPPKPQTVYNPTKKYSLKQIF